MRPPDWTPKEIDRLRELAAEGLSSEAIGRQMGRTKNSVIGACRRRGIALTYRQYPPLLKPFTLSIIELQPGQCRWPSPGDGPWTFCAALQVEGGAYCEAHASIAYQRLGARVAA